MNEPITNPAPALAVIAFPESSNALVVTSARAAVAFGFKPRRFAAWVREKLAELGPELSGDVQRLSFKSVDLALLAVKVELRGRAPVELVAAVMPDELDAGEKALGDLRARLLELHQSADGK